MALSFFVSFFFTLIAAAVLLIVTPASTIVAVTGSPPAAPPSVPTALLVIAPTLLGRLLLRRLWGIGLNGLLLLIRLIPVVGLGHLAPIDRLVLLFQERVGGSGFILTVLNFLLKKIIATTINNNR